jgi:hypothetical protein
MKRGPVVLLAICLFGSVVAAGSGVRDLPKSDPDRSALLDAARAGEDVKFVVRDFVKAGDYAFLCALKKERSGGIVGTDDMIDVYRYFFVRESGRWIPIPREGGFTNDVRDVPCEIDLADDLPRAPGETHPVLLEHEADLVRVIVSEVQSTIRHDLDAGAVDPDAREQWELLGRKKVARDFSIEHEKPKTEPLPVQVTSQQRACKSAACKKAVEDAFHDLLVLRNDERVSSLVWANCWQDADLAATRACVSAMSSRPYCRPAMKFVADRRDIDRCAAEIRQRTRR